ncbi:hypothetical protein NPIL_680721 [Nephila pilipes]|uniref:Uncharacterized protein n=1 Tax=Nephila pilipes TaxID=299642 RepID=A0A8X6NRN3_NEPPI|nr:hypothetical protein NPIL_680721 [Nephila pilipes]
MIKPLNSQRQFLFHTNQRSSLYLCTVIDCNERQPIFKSFSPVNLPSAWRHSLGAPPARKPTCSRRSHKLTRYRFSRARTTEQHQARQGEAGEEKEEGWSRVT